MKFNMGKWPHAFAVAGLVSSVCAAAAAWGKAGDNGQFFVIEGLYLAKDDADTVPFTVDLGGGGTPFALVTSDDIDLDDTGGARATAQFESFGQTWQASVFAVAPFDAEFFISGLDPAVGNTSTTYADFVGGTDPSSSAPLNSDEFDTMDLQLDAELWGAEFSWVKSLGGYGMNHIDLLAGVRYIRYGEDLKSVVLDTAATVTAIDRARIEVENDLVGVQLGLQAMWDVASIVSVGGSLKGGLAANFINRDRSFSADNANYPASADGIDDTNFAQFAEFNPRVDLALSESASLTIAGTVLWLNNTSQAASHYESVADASDANIRDGDDELFYGASVGLKLALN